MNNEIVEVADEVKKAEEAIAKIQSNGLLNELIEFIRERQEELGRRKFSVGDEVVVCQKTKKTVGIITKVKWSRCLVDYGSAGYYDGTRIYDVPMSMMYLHEKSNNR